MDVVITYVDITERFKEQYSKYVKKELEENRFRSYGVLDLQIKGIRKYMPYIKNIFVVVSEKEQVEGIDLSDAIIIEHKDIIPERYLPCFNSCSIEMFLWKIPGLAEEFIYFNDDIFVIDKIHPSKWFIKGKPVLFPKEHEIKEEENIFKRNCINSSKLAIDITGSDIKDKYFTQTHCARPFLKSSCEKVFNLKVLDIIHSLTRTRHSKNYNASLFNDYDYLSGKAYKMEVKYTYTNAYNTEEEIINYINKKENSLICINDTDYYIDFDEFKAEIRKVLEANLKGKKYVKEIKKEKINITDKLIVSFTSWTKRIQYCKHTVDLMMNQTVKSDKIILNLSEEEFPNKESDLPKELLVELIQNPLFEIYWVKENTTVWKKIIPTMNRFPNDLVFSIDDDIEYPSNYIEEMYKTYCENNKLYPIVAYGSGKNNIFSHSGPFTLTSKKFYGKYIDELFNNLIYPSIHDKKWQSDIFYTYALLLNNGRYKRCKTISGKKLYDESDLNKINAYSAYNSKDYKTFNTVFNTNKKDLNEFIKKEYNVENIFSNSKYEAIISLTTWKKRINNIYKTINNLLSFCDNRFKIVLTLSSDEINENELPLSLTSLLGDNFEILWVKKNYKVFKKILFTMEKYPLCPIISADDDCLYKFNYINELFNYWKLNKFDITTLLKENKWRINNTTYYFAHGCATIYPPSSLINALKYLDNEKILNTNNDDSFYGIFAKINNIKINYLDYHIDSAIKFHTNEGALTYQKSNQLNKFLNDKKIIINELCKN